MAEDNLHTHYSHADIERYLKGLMTPQEMHALERAALNDPFLSDAIEGYRYVSNEESRRDLDDIAAALHAPQEKAKVIPLRGKSFFYWKVAAVVIVIGATVAVTWMLTSRTAAVPQIAETRNTKKPGTRSDDTIAAMPGTDTTRITVPPAPGNDRLTDNSNASAKKTGDSQKGGAGHAVAPANRSEELPASLKDSFSAAEIQPAAQAGYDRPELTDKNSIKDAGRMAALKRTPAPVNTFTGRILDNNGKPVPYAVIVSGDQVVVSDSSGDFTLNHAGNLVNVTVSSAGFLSRSAEIKSASANTVLLPTDKAFAATIETKRFGTAKDSATLRRNASDSAYPEGGWQSFQAYIYKKMNKPFDSTVEVTGDVQLEFLIDDDGNPYNFSVLHSMNEVSAAKAIAIIKEGPRWIAGNSHKKSRVTIRFRP